MCVRVRVCVRAFLSVCVHVRVHVCVWLRVRVLLRTTVDKCAYSRLFSFEWANLTAPVGGRVQYQAVVRTLRLDDPAARHKVTRAWHVRVWHVCARMARASMLCASGLFGQVCYVCASLLVSDCVHLVCIAVWVYFSVPEVL